MIPFFLKRLVFHRDTRGLFREEEENGRFDEFPSNGCSVVAGTLLAFTSNSINSLFKASIVPSKSSLDESASFNNSFAATCAIECLAMGVTSLSSRGKAVEAAIEGSL